MLLTLRSSPDVVTRIISAPEILLGDEYHAAIDIWAAGTCLSELITVSPLLRPCRVVIMPRLHFCRVAAERTVVCR